MVVVGAMLTGPYQEVAMSDDVTLDGPPTYILGSPGVVTTSQIKPFADFEIHTLYLDPERRLHTVRSYLGEHPANAGMHPFDPVDWETKVPQGAQLFSVTAGVGAQTVKQFWLGWISKGQVYLDALTEDEHVAAALAPDESAIFPAVMHGSGAASLFSWKPTGDGVALSQRSFAKKSVTIRTVLSVPGRPVVSRTAAIPGRPGSAVIGWIEQAGTSSILSVAVLEGGRAKMWRSQPVTGTTPVRAQRIGVWASADDALEVTALLSGSGEPPSCRLSRFGVRTSQPQGQVKTTALAVQPSQLARAAIDYSSSVKTPKSSEYFLTKDGDLLVRRPDHEEHRLAVVRRAVPLDSSLPIVADYWIVRRVEGGVDFERLRPLD
jgi:hypothetical protein